METEKHHFTEEELGRMEKYSELLGDREEVIELLDNYSYFFADWSIIINEAVQEMNAKKQSLGVPCENEQEMLTNINFFFSRMAYFSVMLSEWKNELSLGKTHTENMIKQGHP